jgi:hypothetical protein
LSECTTEGNPDIKPTIRLTREFSYVGCCGTSGQERGEKNWKILPFSYPAKFFLVPIDIGMLGAVRFIAKFDKIPMNTAKCYSVEEQALSFRSASLRDQGKVFQTAPVLFEVLDDQAK